MIVALPLPPLPVAGLAVDSPFLVADAGASIRVEGLTIRRDGRPVVAAAPDETELVRRLEQFARWTRLADLRNPLSRMEDAVELTVTPPGPVFAHGTGST